MRSTKNRTLQQGLAVIEFAIILPLLLFMALAVTELGRAMYQYNTLTKSVQDGVRYLSDRAIGGNGLLQLKDNSDRSKGLILDTKKLVIYGNINGGTPLLPTSLTPEQLLGTVTVDQIPVDMEGDPPGVVFNHVKVTADYNFSPLFSLGGLGYQRVIPDFTVSAVERALRL